MREITQDNLKDLTFDGIVVSVPRENVDIGGAHDDISFIFECAYYSKGKHGYPDAGSGSVNYGECSFYSAWYNDKDYLPNGLCFNSTSRFSIEEKFAHMDKYHYYKFENMEEFCKWYLDYKNSKRSNVQLSIRNTSLKMTRREKYSEIIDLLNLWDSLKLACTKLREESSFIKDRDALKLIKSAEDKLNTWLDEEVDF